MEYAEWEGNLFESTYPQRKFPGGLLKWVSKDELIVVWDGVDYKLDPHDFQQTDDETDGFNRIVSWVYENMGLAHQELDTSYIYLDIEGDTFKSATERYGGVVYIQNQLDPHVFPRYAEPESDDFQFHLKGTMLHIRSQIDGLPALCSISHPITLQEVSRFFDFDDDIHLLVSLGMKEEIFIGNAGNIARLKEDEDSQSFISLPITQWQEAVNKKHDQSRERTPYEQ